MSLTVDVDVMSANTKPVYSQLYVFYSSKATSHAPPGQVCHMSTMYLFLIIVRAVGSRPVYPPNCVK